ncbi:MAG: DUF11 domain-containing protein [Lewinellaceae bacterium]|nr:DUF11 domain-containing protein [Lewinellaceae bacterium]
MYLRDASNLGLGCINVHEFAISDVDENFVVDFPIQSGDCPRMGVDLSGLPPRPCVNQIYQVRGCNYGFAEVQDAYVDVHLDPRLLFQTSSIPGTALPGNTWRFDLGNMFSNQCRDFTVTYQLDCDVPAGQTICSEAVIYPDTICLAGTPWNGAQLLARAACVGDSVQLILKNNAQVPSPVLNYIIAEDIIMYRQDVFQIDAGDSVKFSMLANGATWHLRAEQEPGYPGDVFTNATIEGCGTDSSGNSTTGVFLQYPFSAGQFNHSRACQEATDSFKPNEIQGLPIGYGSTHLIQAGDEIEYQIQFQNTGTDTVHTVHVREFLPAGLDPTSVVPGAASHPYTFLLTQDGLLRFIIEYIDLPDSSSNPAGSIGYVSYRARTFTDIPNGSVISGAAEIHFDTLASISTDTVFHTVGEAFIPVVWTNTPIRRDLNLQIYPNPATHTVQFICDNCAGTKWQVELFDTIGRLRKTVPASGEQVELHCVDLPAGLYLFHILIDGHAAGVGKLIVK